MVQEEEESSMDALLVSLEEEDNISLDEEEDEDMDINNDII